MSFLLILVIVLHIFVAPSKAAAEQDNVNPILNSGNTTRPNIVLILADDVGTGDLPFYWKDKVTTHIKMPNLENFANKAVLFTDAHSTPLCAPSRYMLLSGNYAFRGTEISGSWNTRLDSGQFRSHQKSIAEALRTQAGYETAAFGKWHLGAKVPPNGMKTYKKKARYMLTNKNHNWTQPLIQGPGDIGFDKSYITIEGIQMPPYSFFKNDFLTSEPSDIKHWDGGTYNMPHGSSIIIRNRPGEGDRDWDSSAYDMIVVNKTRDFIDEHLETRSNDPFFAYVALGAVHTPHSPPDYYSDGSPAKGVYETSHLDMLGVMDKAVGSINKIVEDRNLTENTIIIFTSDNGGINKFSTETGHLTSGPLRGAKSSIYEGGHRVPLMMRYDGKFEAGTRRNKMVGLNDLYSTICDLAGISVPIGSAQDSTSFAPYVENAKSKKGLRTYLGTWIFKSGLWQRAIRRNNLKLIHHSNNNTFEMYNLRRDIGESTNILNKNSWAKKNFRRMRSQLQKIGPCPVKDTQSYFDVKFTDGSVEQHNCAWFQKEATRCDQYVEGELKCTSICGRYNNLCKSKNMYS